MEAAAAPWPRRALDRLLSFGPLLVIIVLLFLFFGLYEPKFWRASNLINVLRNSSYLMIISAGQMMVLIIGGFDLSVGAVVALTSVTTALTMTALYILYPDMLWLAITAGIGAGLLVGATIGVVNGLTVALLRASSVVVTLGTLSVATGIAYYVTTGVPVYGMPDAFTRGLGSSQLFGLPVAVFIMLVVLAALWWVMNWTRFGRYVYAIGSNVQAARVSGVPTGRYIVATYAICSVLAAVTGVLLTARVSSGEAALGQTLMLESIAAAVIGGVSLRGGVGRVELVALGALFLTMVTNGMNLIRVDSKLQIIVLGITLVVAVGLDRIQLGRSRR
jgi:ribose transport system permease protein